MRLIIAFFAAAALPAVLITAWYLYGQFEVFEPDDPYIWIRTRSVLVLALVVSAGFVVILGVPTYFLMRHFKIVRWWTTLVAGFFLGSVPMAIFTWPLRYPELKTNATTNGVQTMIDGVPTIEGWLLFVKGVAFFGICGVVASLAFFLIAPNKRMQPDQMPATRSFGR